MEPRGTPRIILVCSDLVMLHLSLMEQQRRLQYCGQPVHFLGARPMKDLVCQRRGGAGKPDYLP